MPRSSRKRGASRRRRSTKRTISRVARPRRSLGRLGKISDTHHFKETVNGGVLGYNSTVAGSALGTGVYAMQLTDLPIFQRFNGCFEFARLNKCTIEFIPKYNMQLFQAVSGNPSGSFSTNRNVTGTFITAIDQVPFAIIIGTTATAINWAADASDSTGTTEATPYQSASITTGYVRGLQGSREKELYKKHKISFMPAFYDYIVTGEGQGTLAGSVSFERKVKKWVTTGTQATTGEVRVGTANGPVYYGPVYALDINEGGTSSGTGSYATALYDVRFTYSMSFKRLRGV